MIADALGNGGLVLDIAGALLLWRYGLPADVRREGVGYWLLEEVDEAEAAKARSYDRFSELGIGLLILGFMLQLISNVL